MALQAKIIHRSMKLIYEQYEQIINNKNYWNLTTWTKCKTFLADMSKRRNLTPETSQ